MGAERLNMTFKEEAFLNCCNWLEQSFNGTVYVMDIDFNSGNIQLFGEPSDTKKFQEQLGSMLYEIRDPLEEWKYY